MRSHDNARKEHFSLGCRKSPALAPVPLKQQHSLPYEPYRSVLTITVMRFQSGIPSTSSEIASKKTVGHEKLVRVSCFLQKVLLAGTYNELHCRTTDQWAYLLRGNARVTTMNEFGLIFIGDVSEGAISVLPAGYSHSIQGLSRDGTEILLIFPHGSFSNNESSFFRSGWPTS